MVGLLIYLLIALLIFSVAYWILSLIPVPPPIANIIRVAVAVIMLIWLIYTLLPFAGYPHPALR